MPGGLRGCIEGAHGDGEPSLFSLGHRTFSPRPGEGDSPLGPGRMWCQASSGSQLLLELALVPMVGVPLCCEAPTQLTFGVQESWLMRPDPGYISTLTATHLLKVFALGRYKDMKVFAKPGFLGSPFIY